MGWTELIGFILDRSSLGSSIHRLRLTTRDGPYETSSPISRHCIHRVHPQRVFFAGETSSCPLQTGHGEAASVSLQGKVETAP